MLTEIIKFIPTIAIVLVVVLLLAMGYVKAPPDTAYIISGLRRKKKILIGRAGIKIPFFERLDKLNLKLIPLDIKTADPVPTQDCINIFVDAAVNVKIKVDDVSIDIAAQNFLNKSSDEIGRIVSEVLEGNVREIICTMKLRDLIGDRQMFVEKVSQNVKPDLEKMGIELVSFNVQNFRDKDDVINNLGVDNIEQIKKDAKIAAAIAKKEIAIAESIADKEANDARVSSSTEIAIKNNELEIKKSELKAIADTKAAAADAAYSIQKQEQEKTIQIATTNTAIAKAEKEVELKAKEVAVMEQYLEAEVNKKADADRYEIEQKAAADLTKKKAEADARKYEAEQEAMANKAEADANKYRAEQEAAARKANAEADSYAELQQAIAIEAKGKAEAEAIRLTGLAEAEAMEKKAQAYQKYNSIAIAEKVINVLPEIAGKIAEPLCQIDKITIIGGGNGESGLESVASNVPVVMAKVFESMKEATGVDISEIVRANTYEGKTTKNINITGLDNVSGAAVAEAVVQSQVMSQNMDDAVRYVPNNNVVAKDPLEIDIDITKSK